MALIAIPLVTVLLLGLVWINVAKLGLTAETGAVVERSRAVEAQTLRLEARLERRDSAVVDRARVELGMAPSSGESVTYLQAQRP